MTDRRPLRRCLRLLAMAVVIAVLAQSLLPAGAAAQAKGERRKIVVATSGNSLLYAVLYLAKFKGYFEQEGLDAELVELAGAPQATQAVLGGSAFLAVAAITATIDAVQKNQPLAVVAAAVNQNANFVVVSKEWAQKTGTSREAPLADRVRALKGARIGVVGPHAANDDLARFILVAHGGLAPDHDAEIVNLGGSANYPPALERKRVDAFVGASPSPETSVVRGHGIVLINPMNGEIPEIRGQVFQTVVMRRDTVDKSRDAAAAAVRALTRAQKLVADQPDEAKRVLREHRFSALPQEVWDLAWANNLPGIARSPVIDPAGYKINFTLLSRARGTPVPEVPFDRVVVNDLAEAAAKTILGR